MVIEIQGVENGELAVSVNNTLVRHTDFLLTHEHALIFEYQLVNKVTSQPHTVISSISYVARNF